MKPRPILTDDAFTAADEALRYVEMLAFGAVIDDLVARERLRLGIPPGATFDSPLIAIYTASLAPNGRTN